MGDSAQTSDGYTASAYFDLARAGILGDEDRVELLDGVIVASPQQGPLHASVLMDVVSAVSGAVASRAALRIQMPFLAGPRSVPEPDLAVVPGQPCDYRREHPAKALLVVEVSDSSLPTDRLSKSRIYAGAGVPEYWIVNLRERALEVFTHPEVARRVYAVSARLGLK